MNYNHPPLILTDTSITDARGTIQLGDLPDPQPECPVRLANTTPLIERLWRIALSDLEKNVVAADGARYFGAGAKYAVKVYTRDISYSGILGANMLYPKMMLASLRHTREMRKKLMFRVSRGHAVRAIDCPWIEEDIDEDNFLTKYHTNSYSRRTDDVIWLWCAADLLQQHALQTEWQWLYDTGQYFFREFYAPFFDESDGLYFGQASFIDVHAVVHRGTGYPPEWNTADCVRVKSLSTNSLYVLGMNAMVNAAEQLGKPEQARAWQNRRDQLKVDIRRALERDDGTLAYFKDKNANVQNRREALGTALAVLSNVVSGRDAQRAVRDYPVTDGGVPLLAPFFDRDDFYHNNSSWPFVDTFFLKALETTDGYDRTPLNAALLARTCVDDGTFHEVTDYRTRDVNGSPSQLWSAAAFIDVCRRAHVKQYPGYSVS